MLKKIIVNSLFLLAVGTAYASSSNFVGPFLNFIDAGERNDQWNLTALVVAPSSVKDESLGLYLGAACSAILPQAVHEVKDQTFWRYSLPFKRNENPYKATYSIGSRGGKFFEITIPEKDSDPHIFFGSCNQLLDPPSTWSPINSQHAKTPYHLALLAGDQLYVNETGSSKTAPGVFEIPSIKAIMAKDKDERMAALTDEQRKEVDDALTKNLLDQYLSHYSKPGFSKFLATVPAKSMADDHEYYDGKGSYTELPPVMERISFIADQFYYLFQHHTTKERYWETGLKGPILAGQKLPLSFSYHLRFKTTSYYGLDTRTERTASQISSQESRDFMFNEIGKLSQKNIFVITGIPLVYQNLNPIYKIFKTINNNSWLKFIYGKVTGQPDSSKNLDITLDFSDHWNFPSHAKERNEIITKLNRLVLRPQKTTVTLLAGDVHSAGAGEVVNRFNGEVRLRQLLPGAVNVCILERLI